MVESPPSSQAVGGDEVSKRFVVEAAGQDSMVPAGMVPQLCSDRSSPRARHTTKEGRPPWGRAGPGLPSSDTGRLAWIPTLVF